MVSGAWGSNSRSRSVTWWILDSLVAFRDEIIEMGRFFFGSDSKELNCHVECFVA